MQLGEALKRIGATIVKEKLGEKDGRLFLRVDPEQGAKWVEAMTSFLTGAVGKPFTVDISKYFYASQGAVRYLWRIMIEGDVSMATTFFAACVVEVMMMHRPEITQFPLVGRIHYLVDPPRGKFKGSHDLQTAEMYVAQAAIGGGR